MEGQAPIVDLIFAFTDSTGLLGAAALDVHDVHTTRSYIGMTASDQKFCVRQDSFGYDRPKGDPSSKCDSGYSLMPASLHFNNPQVFVNSATGDWEGASVSVELGAKDRAIPWQGSSTSTPTAAPRPDAPTPGSSRLEKFIEALKAARVETLRKNVRAYIAAAETGFESYKKGAAQVIAGNRVWSAKEISLPADSCIVIESATDVIFRCLYDTLTTREAIEGQYADLMKNVVAALPEDWKLSSESDTYKVFGSSSGLKYTIWTRYYDSKYELRYQVLAPRRPGEGIRNAAPSKPAPAPAPNRSMTTEDDPIGEGGFITPYIVPSRE